jgi:hypothetical protein
MEPKSSEKKQDGKPGKKGYLSQEAKLKRQKLLQLKKNYPNKIIIVLHKHGQSHSSGKKLRNHQFIISKNITIVNFIGQLRKNNTQGGKGPSRGPAKGQGSLAKSGAQPDFMTLKESQSLFLFAQAEGKKMVLLKNGKVGAL